jgi:hypothetical protein
VIGRALALLPAVVAGAAIAPADVAWPALGAVPARVERLAEERTACEGARAPLPEVLAYALRSGAFAGSPYPDVAVHVPPGFDGTRRPGVLVYFHGWSGCAAAALSSEPRACREGEEAMPGGGLAARVDEAGANAIVVAVETRAGMPTGEPGRLAMPGGLRELLRELFAEHLADPLGCSLDVDGLDRVVLAAHSGGYQALVGAMTLGDVPRVTEVDLLDALYGGDDAFFAWLRSQGPRFDGRAYQRLRFVDLYSCCGGTAARSEALAERAGPWLREAGLGASLAQAETVTEEGVRALPTLLAHGVVFARVPRTHSEIPGAYLGELVRASGFARRSVAGAYDDVETGSHSLRLN